MVGLIAGEPPIHPPLTREFANPLDGFRVTPRENLRRSRNHADRVDVGTRSTLRGEYVAGDWT
jgi:hypothetical protein